ncbi:MAG: TIGR00730 family Rossman fold protein, partial [Comamonadaceae bacterium]|nr:TIGR00730 family Rossman fold protein [Comamonadaceae bacterium]
RGIRFQLELLKPDLEQAAHGIEHTVVVYGSARFVSPEDAAQQLADARASGDAERITRAERAVKNARYYDLARQFARHVADYSQGRPPAERLYICTGGGPGIMEAANRGAYEAGAPTIGLNITLPHEQNGNRYITPELSFKFHYFALRKMHFMMRAKALVVFPGGFGTLDELFEVLTLVQTGKAKPAPIVLFGTAFWKRLVNFDALVEQGTVSPEDLKLFHYTDDPAEAWGIIRAFYEL